MASLDFKARIEIYNGNPYVFVSAKQATILKKDWRKPLPVTVKINGKPDKPWHINMMPIGDGSFYLYLHGDVRAASKTKVGDMVAVAVAFDETYHNGPLHPMSAWFKVPLDANPKAKASWEKLPPSRKKEILRYFSWLKSNEAKQRNVERALYVLSGNEGRFMARTWKDGR
jgi:hypothetical protein